MSRQSVNSIFDLLIFPTENLYDVKDVILIFHTTTGEEEKPLIENGEVMFDEEFLDRWIKSGKLEYKTKDDGTEK